MVDFPFVNENRVIPPRQTVKSGFRLASKPIWIQWIARHDTIADFRRLAARTLQTVLANGSDHGWPGNAQQKYFLILHVITLF
ncbi:hypothetical protein, partial [Megasphaera sp.]|uniref:hypothetical protein n=1 Tax=Megasphaera sp. TaxID=2023260 RepID=UPI003A8FCE25